MGHRAVRAGGAVRRRGSRARLARAHRGGRCDPLEPAAREHGPRAGAGGRDSRGSARVSALPIFGEQGAGSGTLPGKPSLRIAPEGTAPRSPLPGVALRPAVLADVASLERLMSPFVATGDLLPRSNYDLCRHIKEYAVAEASAGGEVVASWGLQVYSQHLGE